MRKTRTIIAIVLTALLLFLGACAQQEKREEVTATEKEPIITEEETTEEEKDEEVVTPEEETAVIEEETGESAENQPPEKELPSAGSEVIRLYYYGSSALGVDPAGLPGAHCIYSATSSDGTSFTEDPGIRFSYDTGAEFGITDPDIIRLNDGSWLMFLSLGTQLLKATSPSTLDTFTLDDSFNWFQGGVSGSYGFNGTIRTFVCYQGGINMAAYDQDNGTLKYSSVALEPPASGLIADPTVIQVGDKYLMFYKYAASPATPPSEHEVYLATSADGTDWSQHPQNRFICKGSVPGAVYYNGVIYVYYCGVVPTPGAPPSDLGVAISRDNGATFTTSTIRIQGRTAAGVVDPAAVIVSPSEQ